MSGNKKNNPYWASSTAPGQQKANASQIAFLQSESLEDDLSSNDHAYGSNRPKWVQSLTPSMSASNVGQQANGEKDWRTLQAAHDKLLTSKEKYDGSLHPSILRNLSPEADDELHDPGPPGARRGADRLIQDSKKTASSRAVSARGVLNVLGVLVIGLTLLMLFAGLPLLDFFTRRSLGITGSKRFSSTSTNSSGQAPVIPGFDGLIDLDTPDTAYSRKGHFGDDYVLIFSDEFNKDGRTFLCVVHILLSIHCYEIKC